MEATGHRDVVEPGSDRGEQVQSGHPREDAQLVCVVVNSNLVTVAGGDDVVDLDGESIRVRYAGPTTPALGAPEPTPVDPSVTLKACVLPLR